MAQVAVLQGADLALGATQVEEQLLLIGGGADLHQGPGSQDIFLDRGPDPPHGVGRQTKALVRLELFDRLHQADVALGDHLADGQAIAAVAHGDLGHQTQMRGHHLVRGFGIAMFLPTLGEHELLVLAQHGKLADLGQIT